MPTSAGSKVRFGPFVVDLSTGELSTNGTRVRLQPQPLKVLEILLERQGELITREEFRKRLWADDTFVDFEHSLNTAIKKLRQALGDEAETPRYIETLPKRGYRFIVDTPDCAETMQSQDEPEPPKPRAFGKLFWTALVAICFVTATTAAVLYRVNRPKVPFVGAIHQLTRTGNHKSAYGIRRVVTDGSRIYFAERIQSQWKIVQMSVQGGETSIVDTGQIQNPHIFDISTDGSELLVGSYGFTESWLWIVPLPAGAPRPVGRTETYTARFTPEGQRVIFAFAKQLFVADKDGGDRQLLLTAEDIIRDFAVSPDGEEIRLSAGGRIFEARIDGSGLHRYMPERANRHCCGEWSPNGRFYVYSDLEDDRMAHLFASSEQKSWSRKAASNKPVQLTFGPIPFAFPTVSRDSKQIFALGEVLKGELQVYDEKSGLFGPYLSGVSAGSVDFTRDGRWICYVSFPEGNLWRSRIDGSEKMQLTFSPIGQVSNPKWSPDNRLIVFEEWLFQSRKVYVMPATGGAPLLLTTDRIDPNWSPDGRFLVYSAYPDSESTIQLRSINDGNVTVVPGSKGLCFPRWSPDGRHLLALSSNLKQLMLYSVATEKWKELYHSDEIAFPSFSHDNQYVYFSHGFSTERGEILRIGIANGKVEVAADLKSIETTMPIFRLGGWFALTPDDKILVLRDRGSDELYALDIAYR